MVDKSIIIVPEKVSWNDERVLTTAQLAEFYECTPENIRDNFRKNADRFVSGKHFFKLEGDELKTFRDYTEIFRLVNDRTPSLFLWTKRGAARHAKMLNTDRAWEVFEALEDNYFDRPAVAPAQAISELAAVEREKLAVEREKLALARDNFATAQLLRDIASSSRDDVLRDKLIREATKILMGDDFFSDDLTPQITR